MDKKLWSVELGRGLGVIELGATREVVLSRLEESQIDFQTDEEDSTHVPVWEMDLQLTFSSGDRPVLEQIAVQDDRVHFASKSVLQCRLHEVTSLLGVNASETVWRMDDDPDDSLPSAGQGPLDPVSDEELLEQGTLWIPSLGLGLRVWRGDIAEVLLRLPELAPTVGVGQLTPQQIELVQRSDLYSYLRSVRHPDAGPKRWMRLASSTVFFAIMGAIVWQAAACQRRWQNAPTVEAEVIATGPGGPDTIATEFTVSYRDQDGIEHQVNVGLADTYVPKTLGEKVELRYLPEAPDQPLSPSRARDAAFVKFMPWAIGAFAGYLVVQVAGAILLRLFTDPVKTV